MLAIGRDVAEEMLFLLDGCATYDDDGKDGYWKDGEERSFRL